MSVNLNHMEGRSQDNIPERNQFHIFYFSFEVRYIFHLCNIYSIYNCFHEKLQDPTKLFCQKQHTVIYAPSNIFNWCCVVTSLVQTMQIVDHRSDQSYQHRNIFLYICIYILFLYICSMNSLLGTSKGNFSSLISVARKILYVLVSVVGCQHLKHVIPNKG